MIEKNNPLLFPIIAENDLILSRSWEYIYFPTVMGKFHSNECCARGQMEATCSDEKRSKVEVCCGNVRLVLNNFSSCRVVSVAVLCCWTDIWQQNVEKCYIMAYKCDKLPIQHIFRRKEADIHVSCVSVNQSPIDNDLNRTWVYVLWTEGTDPHTRSSRRTMHGKTLPSTVVSKPRLPPQQCVCMSHFDV